MVSAEAPRAGASGLGVTGASRPLPGSPGPPCSGSADRGCSWLIEERPCVPHHARRPPHGCLCALSLLPGAGLFAPVPSVTAMNDSRPRSFLPPLAHRPATDAPSPPVTAMIFTLNEEANLPRCLDSLRWCDDVIVVHSLSSDRTEAICRERNVRFFQHAFRA